MVCIDNFADENGNIVSPPAEIPGDWSKELVLTIVLKDNGGKTDFTLEHTNMPVEAFDDWQESLDKLETIGA